MPSSKTTMDVAPRIDIPALMRALKASDVTIVQKAGQMLGHYACRYEEHREAIAAQQESIIAPLAAHLISLKAGLVHNASLLLGQCLYANTEFRQVFEQDQAAARALVATMNDADSGVVVNATWAIRNFFSDAKCELNVELLDLVQAALPPLLVHSDARVQKHASKLSVLVQQRREHLSASIQRSEEASEQAVKALTSIRGDSTREENCIRAIEVLAALTTGVENSDDEESSPTIREHSRPMKGVSPRKTIKKNSPRRLESWNKALAFKFSSRRKVHATVSHAAAG